MKQLRPIGHEETLQRLVDAFARDRLPHALLFSGAPGIGKSLAALSLAARLACNGSGPSPCADCAACLQIAAGSHPDLQQLSVAAGKKEIGIDAVRRLKHFIAMQAVAAPRKMAIIDDADRLSIAAQNALLKTLEEPPGQALLMLVTASPDNLLTTVRSRCQRVVFRPLADDQVADVLQQCGVPPEEARPSAARAEGSPGRALARRESWDRNEWEEMLRLLAELDAGRYGSILAMSKTLGRTEREMSDRLEALLSWYRDEVVGRIAGRTTEGAPDILLRRADVLADALRTLRRRNPNRPLLAEAIALRLARI
jgi:DNA polymerase III subunit delta'